MWIDEAWGDDQVGRIDCSRGAVPDSSDLRDYSIFDRNVGSAPKRAGPIDDGAVFDNQVICHQVPSSTNATLGIAGRTIKEQGFT
jgi:hypothetical protein